MLPFFFLLLSEVVRNRLFAFLSPSQSPLLRAWRLSRCWGCRHGAAEMQGYGRWKPVLLALCSSSREDSEWNQDQGHRHQDLNSFLCSLCVREHGLRVHLQFLLNTKGCWESWVTQSQYNVWQHLPLKKAGMDTNVQLVFWRGCSLELSVKTEVLQTTPPALRVSPLPSNERKTLGCDPWPEEIWNLC